MDKVLLSLIAAGLMTGTAAAPAAAAPVEFRGALCLTGVPLICNTASGWKVGDCVATRYSPPGLGTNGVSTKLTLFESNRAQSYTLASGTLVCTVFKTVSAIVIGRGPNQFPTTMRITSQTPALLTATTPTVSIKGDISKWDGEPTCTVQFQAAGTLRP